MAGLYEVDKKQTSAAMINVSKSKLSSDCAKPLFEIPLF